MLHRDLKPGNLLVNADCELKICDFGLSRGFDPDQNTVFPGKQEFMTEYVATRWYRAPEIMLSHQNYTSAIDLWSVGCILAELLGRKPLFKGRDYVDQLNQIIHYLGTPSNGMLARIASPRAQQYIKSLPFKPQIPFEQIFPEANPQALDLLRRLLAFDPSERITCEEALIHPYLSVWHDPEDEPVCSHKFDFSFESVDDMEGMKKLIFNEVVSFRREVRIQAQQRQAMMEQSGYQQYQQHSNSVGVPAQQPYVLLVTDPSAPTSVPFSQEKLVNGAASPNIQYQGHSTQQYTDRQVLSEKDAMEAPHGMSITCSQQNPLIDNSVNMAHKCTFE